jgi:hypothetical protein
LTTENTENTEEFQTPPWEGGVCCLGMPYPQCPVIPRPPRRTRDLPRYRLGKPYEHFLNVGKAECLAAFRLQDIPQSVSQFGNNAHTFRRVVVFEALAM